MDLSEVAAEDEVQSALGLQQPQAQHLPQVLEEFVEHHRFAA
jgi:hypothetical protein